jgi:hypothetical protein
MRDEDVADPGGRRCLVSAKARIALEEGIDQDGMLREVEPKSRVAVPGDAHVPSSIGIKTIIAHRSSDNVAPASDHCA